MAERFCVLVYEPSETGKKLLRDALTAFAITDDTEVRINWLKPTAAESEIAAVCAEEDIAFISAAETERAVLIGRLLLEENPDCALIYYGDTLPEGKNELISYFRALFPARPIAYLCRPTERDIFNAARDTAGKKAGERLFSWETKGIKYRIPLKSILYFRSDRNYVSVRLKNGAEYAFLAKLSAIEGSLPSALFVRVHQSYLVMRTAIMLIDKGKKYVKLNNGEEIFISKAHYKETLEI